ncbi:MAG: PIG-L family deacetylase [Oscillospiraceae bacterium]|nr:PIG-L family deacetylase [Oscillospiraceae bacterium]MDD4414054.1 PIG-L family deacetylase [Oscillospiraceae bacterium]
MQTLFKKKAAALVLIILLSSSYYAGAGGISQKQKEAQSASLPLSMSSDKNSSTLSASTDGNRKTVWEWHKSTSLKIKSKKAIGAIYIIWDRKPVPFSLLLPNPPVTTTTASLTTTHKPTTTTTTTTSTNIQTTSSTSQSTTAQTKYELNAEKYLINNSSSSQKLTCGTGGFLHEYIKITNPGCSFTLTLHNEGGMIADIYAFEPGKTPGWVQQWQPMPDKADMLVFSCHADDEYLWFGGTLPVYAGEYKKKVQVAYLIRHGQSRNEYFRNHELLDGLWKVGVRNYPMISDFEDYYASSLREALNIYNEEAMIKYTVMLLRRFKPDVVIGHDPGGEYGHGVHSLCSHCLKEAIPKSSNPEYNPKSVSKYGLWKIKKCYLHLYNKNTIVMDWDVPLKAFGGKTGFEMAVAGYKCHSSQQSKWFYVQGKGSSYDSRKFGLYFTTVGKDIAKNDFFEHIAPVIPITVTPATKYMNTSATTTTSAFSSTTLTKTSSISASSSITSTPTTADLTVSGGISDNSSTQYIHMFILSGVSSLLTVFIAALSFLYVRTRYSIRSF